MPRTALLAGASGLVGGHCLRRLLADDAYERVTTLGRRTLPLMHPKLVQRTLEFHRLADLPDFPRARDVFCCLGTTMKQAGSAEAFYRVDFTHVYELARLAARHGAQQFLLVSAIGAHPRSWIFYNRVKGEVEEAVARLPFKGIHIFRPSLLLGDRGEHRPGERLAAAVMPALAFVLVGPLRKYRSILAEDVAAAMTRVAREERPGVHVYQGASLSSRGG
ncbi:MAG: oxidoreductase [Gemmatimonadales bacterium]